MKPKIHRIIIAVMALCIALFVTASASAQLQVISSEIGTVQVQNPEEPCVPPGYYEMLDQEILTNVARLAAEGNLIGQHNRAMPPPQKFDWPLTHETNFYGNDYFYIQNYVDHDTVTGSISEYMCGNRSYDLPNGYDHQGTDICIGPYWWNMMDDMKVRVIAAAPGQIVGRADTNFDRNCGFGAGNPNFITIQHEDGTRALYLHMKNGSVTTKGVGEFVTTGEFLGYVGSSGSSTNPHLHFEIRDSLNNFIDPWQGGCNPDIFLSLWNDQKPYPNSGIMSILTMWGNPTVPPCPNPETVPLSNHFDQGAFVRVEIHLRDLIGGTSCLTKIYNPSGGQILSMNNSVGNNFAAGNWVGFTFNLPNNSPVGTYKVQSEYQGKKAAHYFTVGCPGAYNLSGPITGYKGYISGSSITTTQTIAGSSLQNIWYEASDFIQANVGFRARSGCSFRARIDNCAENIPRFVYGSNNSSLTLKAVPSIVSDKTKLNLELLEGGTVSITVYDITGRKIKSVITDQYMMEGVQEFELNVNEFTPGIYICSAHSGESKSQCKIVVQK